MAIILSGDTHGMHDMGKVTEYFYVHKGYSKDDYLIILGDTGILWDGGQSDREVQTTLENLPVTTLWIDGNHDNFDMLEEYDTEIWHGGKVQFISDSIIHLCRGQVFELEEKTFFTFGGGYSTDKMNRTAGITWWPQEMPSNDEYEEGLNSLERAGWKVDYILTHTCPEYVAQELVTYIDPEEEPLQRYLEQIAEYTECRKWYFGHWHMDETIDDFRCLYNDMVELDY